MLPEIAPETSYVLRNTARYAHKDSYIQMLTKQNGFKMIAFNQSPTRNHGDHPVQGLYYVLAKM